MAIGTEQASQEARGVVSLWGPEEEARRGSARKENSLPFWEKNKNNAWWSWSVLVTVQPTPGSNLGHLGVIGHVQTL